MQIDPSPSTAVGTFPLTTKPIMAVLTIPPRQVQARLSEYIAHRLRREYIDQYKHDSFIFDISFATPLRPELRAVNNGEPYLQCQIPIEATCYTPAQGQEFEVTLSQRSVGQHWIALLDRPPMTIAVTNHYKRVGYAALQPGDRVRAVVEDFRMMGHLPLRMVAAFLRIEPAGSGIS